MYGNEERYRKDLDLNRACDEIDDFKYFFISRVIMGNANSVNSFSTKKKQLLVRIGIQRGKGTDANISIILFENSGRKTKPISLDYKFRDDFESGHTDNFPIDPR